MSTHKTTKRNIIPFSTSERHAQATSDAKKLIELYGSLNKAASAIGMNRGRLSWIVRSDWKNVALNELDLVMLSTGRVIREKDFALTSEARQLAERFQQQLSDLHVTAAQLLRVLRKL